MFVKKQNQLGNLNSEISQKPIASEDASEILQKINLLLGLLLGWVRKKVSP